MLGTILIVLLILALLGALRGGHIAETGATIQPVAWESFCWSLSCYWFLVESDSFVFSTDSGTHIV